MVKYIGKNGKEYILRFDMSAYEAMKEEFGGMAESMQQLSKREAEIVKKMFTILAQAGAEYIAERDGKVCTEKINADGLLTKHSSIGRLNGMAKAINEAILDGNRMQSRDEEDDEIRDGYLQELNDQEKEKN